MFEIQLFQNLTLKIQGQVMGMFKFTKWVPLPINLHLFRSMSISQSTPGIQLFQNLTLEIQGHIMGPTSYPLISLLFHFNLPYHSWCSFFIIWPLKSKVKVKGEIIVQSHIVTNFLSTHNIPFIPPIPGIQHFQNLTLKIQGKVMKEVIFPGIQLFFKFDFENPRSRYYLKVTLWVQHPIDSHPFCPC